MKFRAALMIGLAGLLMRATMALAAGDNPPGPPQDGQRRSGPPREAIEACTGKKAGDAVTVKTPDGRSMKSTCTLVAVPSDHDRPPMQK
jgi:hypothetical protein